MFSVDNHGTILLIRPLTADVSEWLTDHTDPFESQWFGGALVVEPRYVEPILIGLLEEGYVAQ